MATQTDPIADVIDRWRGGEPPDARAVLSAHPEILQQKSVVLDLAYEEYCLRTESGERVAPSTFCERFPTYRHSLQRLLEVHQYLRADPAAAALLKEPKWPAGGEEFLGFEIGEELGRGAIGRVFLARQPALGNRPVVLKLSVGGAAEAETLGRLAHPGVVPVFSVEEDAPTGLAAICMPYLGTATLCDVLDRAGGSRKAAKLPARVILEAAGACRDKPASADLIATPDRLLARGDFVDGVLHLGVQLARALAFAHSKGILHRDLKPSNVLVTPSGKPMLLDFNLSFDQQLSGARVGGTLPYAAPEQLRGIFPGVERNSFRSSEADAGRFDDLASLTDPRSDVFSLGAILYELLAGELPFPMHTGQGPIEATVAALLTRQAAGPVSLRERNPRVDPASATLVQRCLKFDPRERPASAQELADGLAACLAPRQRIGRWGRRNSVALACAAAIVAVVLTAVGWRLVTRDPYPVREFRAGAAEFAVGDYRAALPHLDLAVAAHPDAADYLFARGQARQHLGDFLGAADDYKIAAEKSPAGIIRASLAYCRAESRLYDDAVKWGHLAIKANYATVELYNNLGYCLGCLGKLDDARWQLDRAIGLNPALQAAYFNRAKIGLRQSLRGSSPAGAITDIERAIELGPPTADLFFTAARLHALDRTGAGRDDVVLRDVRRALELGLAPQDVRGEPLFAEYLARLAGGGIFNVKAASQSVAPILLIPPLCPAVDHVPAGN